MLYLEARCISRRARRRLAGRAERLDLVRRARRSRLPGGTRAILAENLIAAWLDLEVASGNDAIASHSADPQDGQADGPVPARHRLRHLRLLASCRGTTTPSAAATTTPTTSTSG